MKWPKKESKYIEQFFWAISSKKKKLTREQELEHENELLRAELAFIKKLRALGMDVPERLKMNMKQE